MLDDWVPPGRRPPLPGGPAGDRGLGERPVSAPVRGGDPGLPGTAGHRRRGGEIRLGGRTIPAPPARREVGGDAGQSRIDRPSALRHRPSKDR